MNYNKLKIGSILSEMSYFTVSRDRSSGLEVVDDSGQVLTIGKEYVEKVLKSGDLYETEEKKTMTQLAELFIASSRIAMTVAYYKKDKKKPAKQYKAEIAKAVDDFKTANIGNIEAMVTNLVNNPIVPVIPGELRVMRGRHSGGVNELGRITFLDMEEPKKANIDYDSRLKQVDPRTIQYLIVDNVKYTLK